MHRGADQGNGGGVPPKLEQDVHHERSEQDQTQSGDAL